jgi:phage-related protein
MIFAGYRNPFRMKLATPFTSHSRAVVIHAGVLEILEDDAGGTYRAVYTVKFAAVVYVLHVFQKKSKSGITTPRSEIELIHHRLAVAQSHYQEYQHGHKRK